MAAWVTKSRVTAEEAKTAARAKAAAEARRRQELEVRAYSLSFLFCPFVVDVLFCGCGWGDSLLQWQPHHRPS